MPVDSLDSPTESSLDPTLVKLLAARFGRSSEITPMYGGFSNVAVLIDSEDGQLVAKAARTEVKRSDVRHEAEMLFELGPADGVPVVRVLALIEDGEWTALCSNYIAGDPGLVLIENGSTDLAERSAILGRVVRRVHERGFVHGDVGLHNTLWRGIRLAALLDWEFARIATTPSDRLGDLAWFWWTTAFRGLEPQVWDSFRDAYRDGAAATTGADRTGGETLDGLWSSEAVRASVKAKMEMIRGRCAPGSPTVTIWDERLAALDGLVVPTAAVS